MLFLIPRQIRLIFTMALRVQKVQQLHFHFNQLYFYFTQLNFHFTQLHFYFTQLVSILCQA